MRPTQAVLIAISLAGGGIPAPASPFAVEVVESQGPFGAPPYYDNPGAVLGAPAAWFYDRFAAMSGGATNRRVKLVEGAYNVSPAPNSTNLLVTLGGGSRIIVRFDEPVSNNPANPYGVDLLVFGNVFYTATTTVHDATDLTACFLTGGNFSEQVKVSVSPGYTGLSGEAPNDPGTWPWHRFDSGPYADTGFPTQAHPWDRAATNWASGMMDFQKPVNPVMQARLEEGGVSVADAMDLYVGSGGGTGFDIEPSGFPSIRYVKIEGIDPDFTDGEVDALSIARPAVVGDALSIAPQNLADGVDTLFYQNPAAPLDGRLSVRFSALDDMARMATAPLTNLAAWAPLPGVALNAVQVDVSPLPGASQTAYVAAVGLSAGGGYAGNGSDLVLLQSSGTNWTVLPFTFDPVGRRAVTEGITNCSAFALARIVGPIVSIALVTNGVEVAFSPAPALTYGIQRSGDLSGWTTLTNISPSTTAPVRFTDMSPPPGRAYYRVAASAP